MCKFFPIIPLIVLLVFSAILNLHSQTHIANERRAFPTDNSQADFKFEHIGREQGLTASSVLSICQDRQGFMWFGTMDGLFRYDGYGMTVYKHDPLDSTSLGNNNVFTILEDRHGTLWLGTAGGGLNRFDREKEEFVRYKHNPDSPNSLSADVVSALYEDHNGNLWAGTGNGLNRIDPESRKITQFVHDTGNPKSMSPFGINAILEDSSGILWVGTDGGLSSFNRETGEFVHFFPGLEGLYNPKVNSVNSVFEDRSGTLWLGVRGALARLEAEQPHFPHFLKTRMAESVYSIYETDVEHFGLEHIKHSTTLPAPMILSFCMVGKTELALKAIRFMIFTKMIPVQSGLPPIRASTDTTRNDIASSTSSTTPTMQTV